MHVADLLDLNTTLAIAKNDAAEKQLDPALVELL
jgi:hypothetical protein